MTWHSPAFSLVSRTAAFGVMEKTRVSIGCLPRPIIREGAVADRDVRLKSDELERTGADRIGVDLFGRPGLQELRPVLGRLDDVEWHREIGEERRAGWVRRKRTV